MVDQDTPIIFIQQMLGHRSLNSTKNYINPHFVRNKNFEIQEIKNILNIIKEKYQ